MKKTDPQKDAGVRRRSKKEEARAERSNALHFASLRAWDPEWENTILACAGRLAQAANLFTHLLGLLADQKTDDIFRHRLFLAAACLGELPQSSAKQLRVEVNSVAEEVFRVFVELLEEAGAEGYSNLVDSINLFSFQESTLIDLLPHRNAWRAIAHAGGEVRGTAICRAIIDRNFFGLLKTLEFSAVTGETIGILEGLVHDNNYKARIFAAEALCKFSPSSPKLVSALIDLTCDKFDWVRFRAANQLRNLSLLSSEAYAALKSLRNHGDELVRRVSSFAGLGSEIVEDNQNDDSPDFEIAPEDKSQLQNEPISMLISLGEAANPVDLFDAIIEVGKIDELPPNAVTVLIRLTDHSELFVRCEAARVLGRSCMRDPIAIGCLLKLLNESDHGIRSTAADGLRNASLPGIDVVAAFTSLLRDPEGYIRSTAAEALGRWAIHTAGTTAALLDLIFTEADRTTRSDAIAALSSMPIRFFEDRTEKSISALANFPLSAIRQ